jgi:plasmid stability protein
MLRPGEAPPAPLQLDASSSPAILDIGRSAVAQLIVRNLDPELVVELRRRAARSGRSTEAEHRELLRSVLKPGRRRRPLKSLLLEMPPVGEDSDFIRDRRKARPVRV